MVGQLDGGVSDPAYVWRVPPHLPALKTAAAVAFGAIAVLFAQRPASVVVAGVAAVLLAVLALRDVVARVRLTADRHGLTVVHGFAGRRRLRWTDVERVRVDERRRLGLRNQLLEIDAGESLHLLSGSELGMDCQRVAATLAALRTGHAPPRPDR